MQTTSSHEIFLKILWALVFLCYLFVTQHVLLLQKASRGEDSAVVNSKMHSPWCTSIVHSAYSSSDVHVLTRSAHLITFLPRNRKPARCSSTHLHDILVLPQLFFSHLLCFCCLLLFFGSPDFRLPFRTLLCLISLHAD